MEWWAPYGYRLENGQLLIAEDEVEVIRIIYERYVHTNEGISGVAKYLNTHGYVKKLRQNGTITGFSASFVKDVLDNPVYMGKIAYGRRKTEKKLGTRNEMHIVEQSEFPIYDGQHEAIISEEDWKMAQEKRKLNAYKREKINDRNVLIFFRVFYVVLVVERVCMEMFLKHIVRIRKQDIIITARIQ